MASDLQITCILPEVTDADTELSKAEVILEQEVVEPAFNFAMTSVEELHGEATYCAVCDIKFEKHVLLQQHAIREHTKEFPYR